MVARLGYELSGSGAQRVVVMHDWFQDRTSWAPLRPYLSATEATYAFVDLRGYGASRHLEGTYTADEASADVLALAEELRWERFALVGHSMSTMVVQRLLQLAPQKITRAVAVTPCPPTGLQLDEQMLGLSKMLALADDARRLEVLRQMWGDRLSPRWIEFKARRWAETAERKAVAAYVDMYGRTDLSPKALGIATPLLVIAGAHDSPPFQPAALERSFLPYYPNARLEAFASSGHYPMAEEPPRCATVLEAFLYSTDTRSLPGAISSLGS